MVVYHKGVCSVIINTSNGNINSSDKEVDMEGYNFNNHRDPSSFSQPASLGELYIKLNQNQEETMNKEYNTLLFNDFGVTWLLKKRRLKLLLDEAVVTKINLNVEVDFDRHILKGLVVLEVERITENINILVLDSKELNISKVINIETGENLRFTLNDPFEVFGSKLVIKLPDDGKELNICIHYETSPTASALKWLTPEETVGQKYPYLYSQCQPIHCRSILPCQDTPSVKITYTAQITIPNELVVLMSAERKGIDEIEGGKTIHKFEQNVPIPTYLIAIVVGALERRSLGHRTFVWSEREVVDKAAYEFADTEIMLKTAEQICGPYVWGVYELIVLPASFPYGGMENPCLTFLSPTLLVGDRSLANVVAHELAHSWTGNLVTPCTFEHFWLSEGFTTFIERKILGRLCGEPMRHFCALIGLKELEQQIKAMGCDNELTKLVLNIVNPDKAISLVPYEKGHTFLFYLEELVGGRIVFDGFLKQFLKTYKFMSIVTKDFKEYFKEYFNDLESIETINWSLWLDQPGMPPVIPKYTTTIENPCRKLATEWTEWDMEYTCPFTKHDLDCLSYPQIQAFLIHLLDVEDLSEKKIKYMQDLYDIDVFYSAEIKFRWILLCIKVGWKEYIEKALRFVNEQGRIKYLLPIYKSLYEWSESKEKILANFEKHRCNMMYFTEEVLAKILDINLII